jgi:extracellular elastinolytic metalloproteinase
MKKITLLLALLLGFVSYSQSNRQLIQSYLNDNKAKFELTSQDVTGWELISEVPGSGTGITSCNIMQCHQGIQIYNALSNVAVKNGQVLDYGNNFKSNIASKVNTTTPSITVIQGIASAYSKLVIPAIPNFVISETIDSRTFKISDGLQEDPIAAKLVYQVMPNRSLKLAWYYQFYSPDAKNAWDIRIDATNGAILEKTDLMLSCSFGNTKHANHNHKKEFDFANTMFTKSNASLVPTPATYRAIPYNFTSPNHSPFQLITTVGNTLASPNGWHDANSLTGTSAALKFTYSRGNNVLAQDDIDANNGNGVRAEGGASLNFDFTPGSITSLPATYLSSSITNLFYMNNIMHDVWYQYGFTEAAGNFQQNNLGRGGVTSATGDYVLADGQDGVGNTKTLPPFTATNLQNRNNANFAALNDGQRPRMQMFMWDQGAPLINYLNINSPGSISGPRPAKDNSFEGTDHVNIPVAPAAITSDLALYTNLPVNVGQNPNSGCQAATNPFDLQGKIVLIRRGGCFFKDKVKNAQNEGALAVIIVDSIPQSAYAALGAQLPLVIGMTSTGLNGITIPAISITKDAGDEIIAKMTTETVNATIQDPGSSYLFSDGSYDNGIVAHEYGHGISNKLMGGGINATCMTNFEQMGEGWSDWFSLMMQIKPGDTPTTNIPIGTYAINEPNTGAGIREFPYTTDIAINPRTLNSSNNPDNTNSGYRYTIGETWATVMWDLTWAYINKYGYDPDIYNGTGGNNKVMRLALDALKLHACNTSSFITTRDKLFAADQATTGGADYCMIAEVFRRRGVGLNASSGDINNSGDQVEDFTPFPAGPNCTLAVDYFDSKSQIRVYPNPSNGLYNVRINKFVGQVTIKVTDINGRVVYNQTDAKFNTEKTIDLSAFQSGIYVLKVTGNDLNYSEKLIKN